MAILCAFPQPYPFLFLQMKDDKETAYIRDVEASTTPDTMKRQEVCALIRGKVRPRAGMMHRFLSLRRAAVGLTRVPPNAGDIAGLWRSHAEPAEEPQAP